MYVYIHVYINFMLNIPSEYFTDNFAKTQGMRSWAVL